MPHGASPSNNTDQTIDRILHAIRTHLCMDVAFVSEFIGTERFFRQVDAAGWTPIHVGDSVPLENGYCQRVVDGRLPRLIPDTTAVPEAMAQPETLAIPIGSHLSVPIRLSDGRVYGTFCCFSFMPDQSLNERDLQMMSAFADLVAYQIECELASSLARRLKTERIEMAIRQGGPDIVFQPIYSLLDNHPIGVECLSRFRGAPPSPPDVWFADAAEVGLGTNLELCAISRAMEAIDALPENIYIALNASPETILSGRLPALLRSSDSRRIVLELTEHAHVDDYPSLMRSLEPLRARGVRVSIDDAGAGYASMRHILSVQPDIIKLDISLTRSIDTDPTRHALAAALIEFARQTGISVLAEGVETAAELESLRSLGAANAQGYFLSRPLPLADAIRCAALKPGHA
ncbi:EAL domain-containing protein [Uliginosibacterium sp. H3]|uniref:EAL domain-containing protein n=1 Tax=Uliginosibacterium silvisoli TaxID=3114758 RepID=A0ABU6KB88_9RHOO|nr:EAL domain-containing protein [Uliginosibacterium sp. H3]